MPNRSVSRINDETVTTARLKQITGLLIDIHGQHEHQSLLYKSKHLAILDAYVRGKTQPLKEKTAKTYEAYRALREKLEKFGVDEESRIRGLVIGGDDYVCKPFSQRELELRVRARIHQRYGDRPAEILQFDGLIINTGDRTVSFNRRYGEFSRIEFDILAFLARHPNRIYSYEQLYDNIWNEPLNESRHNVQARIASVRQKLFDLCPGKEYIQTVRRKGYQFVP
jgi:response regulator RpfG family c-di-GMP phosphodiesterase